MPQLLHCMEIIAGLWTVNAPMVSTETFSSSPTSHRATTWPLSSVRYILDSFGHFSLSFEHFFMSGWRWRTRLENQKRQKLFKSDVSKILILKFRNISSFYEKCSILLQLKTENMKICHRLLLKVGKYLEFRNQNFTGDHCMKSLFTFLLWLPPDRRGVVDRSK